MIRAQAPKPADVYWEDLCFDLQQAVEKSLKAVLVLHDAEFPRTHHIEQLISFIKKYDILWPDTLDEAAGLTIYAVQARYPGVGFNISEKRYRTALDIAERVVDWAQEFISE